MSAWREKEPLRVRPELFEAGRLQEKSRSVFDGRSVVIDVITQECFLIILAVAYSHVRVQGSLPRVGVMGAGHVGTALIMKLLKNNYPAKFVSVSTRQPEKIQKCEALNSAQNQNLFENVQRHNDNARLSRESDVLVLAIPPSQLKSVSIQIKHSFSSSHSASFVISTLAGVPLEHIQKSCGTILAFRTKIYVPFILQQKKGSYCAEELAAGEMGRSQQDIVYACEVFQKLYERLGISPPEDAKRFAVETILGGEVESVLSLSICGRKEWNVAWVDALQKFQAILSASIQQIQVPRIE